MRPNLLQIVLIRIARQIARICNQWADDADAGRLAGEVGVFSDILAICTGTVERVTAAYEAGDFESMHPYATPEEIAQETAYRA